MRGTALRTFSVWFAVSTLTAGACAEDSQNDSRNPRIRFAEKVFDFGELGAGQVVQHDFVFTNVGNRTLEISEVRPSCGCTTTRAWDRRTEPGQHGVIPVQFNSSGFSGRMLKTIIVVSDDPAETNVVLEVTGTIRHTIEIMPTVAVFNLVSEERARETRVVRIINTSEEPLTLSEPECANRAFHVALETVRPGKEFVVRVAFTPSSTATNITAPITLRTSFARTPVLTVPVIAIVQPVLAAEPSELALPNGPLPNGARMNVTIRNRGAKPLRLSEPGANIEGVTARIEELQPGRLFSLALNFPPGFKSGRGGDWEARVKTDHPQYPVFRIPVGERKTLAARLNEEESDAPATDLLSARSRTEQHVHKDLRAPNDR